LVLCFPVACTSSEFAARENSANEDDDELKTSDDPKENDTTGNPSDKNDEINSDFDDDGNNDKNGILGDGSDDADGIKDACDSSDKNKRTVKIKSLDPQKECDWNQNSNIATAQAVITARHEAYEDLGLGDDEVLCSMEFSFENQNMRYDDEVSLLFNGRFLMHSRLKETEHFDKDDGLILYDWSKIVGKPYDNTDIFNHIVYCVGESNDSGKCTIPPTEKEGKLL